jgi:hypothetical protein
VTGTVASSLTKGICMSGIKRPPRGLFVAATVAALVTSAVPVAATTHDAAAAAAASWLAGQLIDGDHLETEWGPNYGGTADVAFGLLAAGTQADTLADVVAYLTTPEAVDAYVHGAPWDGNDVEDPAYAGATGKLGLLTTVAGLDPRAVGGSDLVATLQGLEADSGRFEDRSDYGNFANLFGQSFGILFLEAAPDVDPTPESVAALLAAQCDDGGFPQAWDGKECSSQVDVTGLVLQALAVSTDHGPDVHRAVAAAQAWLADAQDEAGAWGTPQNVNSTGYAGMGILATGADATSAQGFLVAAQNDDGGLPISPGDDSDALATAQALPLLADDAFAVMVAGPWTATPTGAERVAGDDRVGTAIAISQASYADGRAATVLLARSDDFADALAGTPVAVAADGPVLLTSSGELLGPVLTEIQRVLPAGGTVHLLGGTAALSPDVAAALADAGYVTVRLGGADRYETAVRIAGALGDPTEVFVTTGLDFPDALAAGTVAAVRGAAVLLTAGATPAPATTAYLAGHDGVTVVAVGGPAAAAHPDADPIVGADRDATAVALAKRYFDAPAYVGVSRRDVFADALGGGVQAARIGAPLLLTGADAVPAVTAAYLCAVADGALGAVVWGGEQAVGPTVFQTIGDRLAGTGC